jgi:methionyl-tRNA formyltransferase
MNGVPWRCVLIGGESLLIECARTLEQQGHAVVAVVSKAAAVCRWAVEREFRLLTDARELLDPALGPVDMLFSVTNLEVLPAEVIALPTRAAVNFHDGPLPAYAGLNTPVWALLNGEAEHGVTWHLMTREVDRGDVLVERGLPIADGETALTLNAKCFEAGIDSFEELVRGLGAGTLQPRPQTAPLQHYYRRR